MKWLIAVCLSLVFSISAFAEEKQFVEKDEYQKDSAKIAATQKEQKKSQADAAAAIATQKAQIEELSKRLMETESRLGKSVSDVGQSAQDAQGKVKVLDENLNKTSTNGIIAIAVAMFLGAGAILFLRSRMSAGDSALEDRMSAGDSALEERIKTARIELEAETIKLDSRLIELLQNQLKVLETERAAPVPVATVEKEVDHTLPMRVAEEIIRMRGRLDSLPPDTKGLKPLLKSLERLEEDFNQQGYEIEEMLNKAFNDGMNVKPLFIPSDDLKPGEQIITKIIRPQINYKGTSIQMAEIEVSTGG